MYGWWLRRLLAEAPEVTPLTVRRFFVRLQERGLSPSRQHQAYRTLKTFLRWCVETGVLADTALRGFTMRTPKTLPDVPTEDELRGVLAACPDSLEGIRNRTLILALADSGLRANELLWLARDGEMISVTVSIGIARFPDHGDAYDATLDAASLAKNTAKDQGKDQIVVAPGR